MQQVIYIGVGGFLGANARYFMSAWVNDVIQGQFVWAGLPLGTMTVNVLGSILLAMFGVWAVDFVDLPQDIRLMVATGFFGAFTTFSTYANESIALIRAGEWSLGLTTIIGTNVLCLLGVILGLWIMERIA